MTRGGWQDPPPGGGGPGVGGGVQFAMPPLTPGVKWLLIANAAAFGVLFVLSVLLRSHDEVMRTIQRALGLDEGLWRSFFPFEPVWQLVTYGFLHSLHGLSHLLYNMLGLYFFGTLLEGTIGTRRFLVFWFAGLLAGALLHLGVELPVAGTSPTAVGASGAVLAVIVACAVLFPRRTVILLLFPIQLRFLAMLVIGLDVFAVLASVRDGGSDGVAHWIHLGGALFGFLAAWRGWIWFDPIQRLEARRAVSREARRIDEARTVDQLLDKIQREGLGSLTRREKEALKRASERQRGER